MVTTIPIASAPTARYRPWLRQDLGHMVALVALVLLSLGTVVIAESPTIGDRAETSPAPIMVPDRAVNGTIELTIPRGAAEAQLDGTIPYVMPAVIRLQVGDAMVVTNEDDYPHIILSSLAMPQSTTTIVFDEPGISAYSSGCTANGGTLNSFTSVLVSESS